MKTCKKCKITKPLIEFQSWLRKDVNKICVRGSCRECIANYMVSFFKEKNPNYRINYSNKTKHKTKNYIKKWQEKNKEKLYAHWRVHELTRSGRLKKQPCEVCNTSIKVHAHHDDYSKPDEVRWLCQSHHKAYHAEIRRKERRLISLF